MLLEPVSDDVWTVTRQQRFWGLETGTRMTVVRLADGGLFVHCPVALDRATKGAVDALGPVRAIAASSLFHHLYVGAWMEAFPGAQFFACPGLDKKRPDLAWTGILSDRAPPVWAADLEQVFFSARFEKEIVFFHRQSRTLICADALIHLSTHPSRVTRAVAFLIGNDAPGKGYLERIAVRDRASAREQVERILRWDIDGIVLAHGALVAHGGREVVRDAYAWL
jgi:hypothetical protein